MEEGKNKIVTGCSLLLLGFIATIIIVGIVSTALQIFNDWQKSAVVVMQNNHRGWIHIVERATGKFEIGDRKYKSIYELDSSGVLQVINLNYHSQRDFKVIERSGREYRNLSPASQEIEHIDKDDVIAYRREQLDYPKYRPWLIVDYDTISVNKHYSFYVGTKSELDSMNVEYHSILNN